MGSTNSTLLKIPNVEVLMQETGFSPAHIIRLHDRFKALDKEGRGHLWKETVDFHTFVKILAHFRPVDKDRPKEPNSPEPINSRSNKLKFAFQLYDQDKDGKISRDELLQVTCFFVHIFSCFLTN
ncbi:hypothetical protein cypCar_00031599 [Cyprinus carpio]|nr:hypothetical protein cypCar_00031599 [Cyprinus carpio]